MVSTPVTSGGHNYQPPPPIYQHQRPRFNLQQNAGRQTTASFTQLQQLQLQQQRSKLLQQQQHKQRLLQQQQQQQLVIPSNAAATDQISNDIHHIDSLMNNTVAPNVSLQVGRLFQFYYSFLKQFFYINNVSFLFFSNCCSDQLSTTLRFHRDTGDYPSNCPRIVSVTLILTLRRYLNSKSSDSEWFSVFIDFTILSTIRKPWSNKIRILERRTSIQSSNIVTIETRNTFGSNFWLKIHRDIVIFSLQFYRISLLKRRIIWVIPNPI